MDKQTFYAELSERLLKLGLSQEYVDRHLSQFDSYFEGKTDEEIKVEIAKLGDLDKVAVRILRMTEKAINEARKENEAKQVKAQSAEVVNEDPAPASVEAADSSSKVTEENTELAEKPASTEDEAADDSAPDEDLHVFEAHNRQIDEALDEIFDSPESSNDRDGSKRGELISAGRIDAALTDAPVDPAQIAKNRKKFWILFAVTLPITITVLAVTAAVFALAYFGLAIIILAAVAGLIGITAVGTLVSVFGLIFGVSQMISSLPIGLYECGISIMIGAVAMFVGILVYNFAVRLMPFVASKLFVFVKFVARKYRELYVYLKKECIGL